MESDERPMYASVPLSNVYSNRPPGARLHARRDGDETELWITGLNIGDYESLVGPERAQAHRDSLYLSPPRRHGRIGCFVRNILGIQ